MEKNKNLLIRDLELFDEGYLLACDIVSETYGVNGCLAVLDGGGNTPFSISKDGSTVLQHIRHSNKTANFGVLQALSGAARTSAKSGDSSTTTCIFMQGYLRNLDRKLFNKSVERGINYGVEEVYAHLAKLSKKATKKDLEKIALVACNSDKELASKVIEAFDYVGVTDGIVECVIKKDKETTEVVKQNGLFLDSHGLSSEFFINKESKQLCFEGENVAVITAAVWEYNQTIINAIQSFYVDKPRNTPLIVFVEKSNSDFTEKLVSIRQVGFNVCTVAVNSYSEYESETLLNDIAMFTGSKVFNPRDPESQIVFGLCDKLVSNMENTSIVVENVPQIFKDALTTLEKAEKKDQRRIKRLKTKAAIIEVGALSDSARIEILHRLDDCINSVKTASAEGFVAAGSSTFVYIRELMNKKFEDKDEQIGYDLVKKVLREPLLRLLKNANREDASMKKRSFLDKLRGKNKGIDYFSPASQTYGVGYNAAKDCISNLLEDGIIDSKKSLRIALESATERAIQTFNISVIVHFPESQSL